MLNYEINGNCSERQRDCVVSAKKKKGYTWHLFKDLDFTTWAFVFIYFLYSAPSVVQENDATFCCEVSKMFRTTKRHSISHQDEDEQTVTKYSFLVDSLKTLPTICMKKIFHLLHDFKKKKKKGPIFQQHFFFLTQTKMEGRHNIFLLRLWSVNPNKKPFTVW